MTSYCNKINLIYLHTGILEEDEPITRVAKRSKKSEDHLISWFPFILFLLIVSRLTRMGL
jgi:hypothetical protein